MSIDLHTHTNCSDGQYSPMDLIAAAKAQGVRLLSITDHDTLLAYQSQEVQALLDQKTFAENDLQLIPGVEISCLWKNRTIHVLGFSVDIYHQALIQFLEHQHQLRIKRAENIGKALAKINILNTFERAKQLAGQGSICRPHFAQVLIELGQCDNHKQAFNRFLGANTAGDQKIQWPSLEEATGIIRAAGGIPTIAHPLKYKMTFSKLRRMIVDFKAAGGQGLEVCSGPSNPRETASLIQLTRENQLMASIGSDFHHPNQNWIRLGMHKVPLELTNPVWEAFEPKPSAAEASKQL